MESISLSQATAPLPDITLADWQAVNYVLLLCVGVNSLKTTLLNITQYSTVSAEFPTIIIYIYISSSQAPQDAAPQTH